MERGERVRALDNFATGSRENLAGICDRIDLVETDLRDRDEVRRACEGVDFILHEGALPSVPRSVSDPPPSHEANIDGTFNVLEGARLAGVKRVLYAASSSAYGDQPGFPRMETMRPEPISPYAVQKLTGELYMQSYWRVFGLETVSLRYFNIFGPRQDPTSAYSGVLARFILQMLRGERPVIFGDGEQSRDFTYVENVIQANLAALEAPATSVAGRVFNIACGENRSLNEVYQMLAEELQFKEPPVYQPARGGDVRMSLASIDAARQAFGYGNLIGFREGLGRTIAWYRKQHL